MGEERRGLHETGVVGHHGGDTRWGRRGGGYMRLVLWDMRTVQVEVGGGGGYVRLVSWDVGRTRWGGYMRLVPWDMGRYKTRSSWKQRAANGTANGRLAVGEKFCQHNPILSFRTGVLCQCRSVPVCWRVSQPPCGSAGA